MNAEADKLPPFERQTILVALQTVLNSPQFNSTQKVCAERLFTELIHVLTTENYK